MVQTPFSKRSLIKSGDFGTLTWALLVLLVKLVWPFQSPYGDFGTPTPPSSDASSISLRCFSPLTGILVMRPDLPWAADQRRKRFSPLTGILVMRRGCRKSVRELVILVSVPLRGFWYSDNLRLYIIIAILSFSPLTGILVL